MSSSKLRHRLGKPKSAQTRVEQSAESDASSLDSREKWAMLAQDLTARVKAYVPGWAGPNSHDPGITLLELFAFLTDQLMAQQDEVAGGGARRFSVDNENIPGTGSMPSTCTPLRRVHYFTGKVMSASDFQAEQDYFLAKLRRHNLGFHGAGVVSGLGVHVEPAATGQGTVVVEPGVAISPNGEQILLCDGSSALLPANASSCYISLLQVDVPVEPVPAVNSEPGTEPSRIEERARLEVSITVPAGGIALAKLEQQQSVWRLDPNFHPPRSR